MTLKTAVISGGASGMGLVLVKRLIKQGVHCAVIDNHAPSLAALCNLDNISTHRLDVSDKDAVDVAIQDIINTYGPIDRLVHCAAIMPTQLLAKQDSNEIHKIMAINYGGSVNICKAVLPGMLKRNSGELIVFGSTGGSVLMPECGAYCASKAATNAFMEVLIEENRASAVHIMLVCPPLVDTPLLKQAQATSNPAAVSHALKSGAFSSPEFIIDELEKAISKRQKILLPGRNAKNVMRLRRYFPGLLWKILRKVNSG